MKFREIQDFVLVLAAGFAGNGGGKKCACGMTQRCIGGEDDACHTDKNDHSWKMDEGVFVDKSVLPVSRMCVGYDTSGSKYRARNVYYLIRDLTCTTAQFGSYMSYNCDDDADDADDDDDDYSSNRDSVLFNSELGIIWEYL